MFFLFWLQTSILGLNFIFNSNPMNKKRYPFWLRFIFFLMVFAVAFFLMIFLTHKSPDQDFKMLLIKIGILAPVSSLFYNILIESDPQIVDWRIFISSCPNTKTSKRNFLKRQSRKQTAFRPLLSITTNAKNGWCLYWALEFDHLTTYW